MRTSGPGRGKSRPICGEPFGEPPAPRQIQQDVAEHFTNAATGGSLYDLVFASDSIGGGSALELTEQCLSRIRPGGTLALHTAHADQLVDEVASSLGLADALPAAGNQHAPVEYADKLLGPLCASLDMWTTTYVHPLTGEEPAYDYACGRLADLPGGGPSAAVLPHVHAALGGAESEAARAFDAEYRTRLRAAYPPSRGGVTLLPLTCFFLVARRPSLLDVYSEYAAYHDHQLEKGWKS